MVVTHVISALLHEVDGVLSHVQEDRSALDHEAHVDAHQVSAESVVLTRVVIELTTLLFGPQFLKLLGQLRNILLLELVLVDWHSLVVKSELFIKLLLHLEHFIDVVDYPVGNDLISRVNDGDVS